LVFLVAIWYILRLFGIFFPFWYVVCIRKNLAILVMWPSRAPFSTDTFFQMESTKNGNFPLRTHFLLCLQMLYSQFMASRSRLRPKHRNLQSRNRIKPWKVKQNGGKSAQGRSNPKQYMYIILRHGKFGRENSIYYMKWGAHTLGTISPFFYFETSSF
jgi:hypothetical protein